ncbi:MAG TPA: alpha/beta hydrolase [Stellaceae bacterium]|nr:alpha/beta hydrolase [Stellaceae bacterium]
MSFDHLEPQTPMRMPAANAYAAAALARSRTAAESSRTRFDVPYGPDPKHRLDLYLPRAPATGTPVLIFLHGGSCTHGYKVWMGFMAPALVDLPAIFVAANYRLAPTHRFPAQLDDTLAILAWTAAEIGSHGGDRRRVFIGGHSAGGHLAGLACLRRDLWSRHGLAEDAVRACFPVSTTFDYRGIPEDAGSFLARPGDAAAASPVAYVEGNRVPFLIAWGSSDFERARGTSREMASALTKAGGVAREMEVPGADHFQMSLDLGDAAHPWTRAVRAWLATGVPA